MLCDRAGLGAKLEGATADHEAALNDTNMFSNATLFPGRALIQIMTEAVKVGGCVSGRGSADRGGGESQHLLACALAHTPVSLAAHPHRRRAMPASRPCCSSSWSR